MMRRSWLLLAPGVLLAGLVFMLALAPARLLAWVLPASQLHGIGYSGSVWQGRVASMRVATPAGPLQLGSVEWTIDPASLLTLAPTVRWRSEWGSQQSQGRARWRGGQSLELSDLEFGVDAGVLRRLLPVTVSGHLSGLLSSVKIDAGRVVSLRGQVSWQKASWRDGDRRFALGDYALEFSPGPAGAVRGEIITLQGPLVAQGSVSLAPDGAFDLTLSLDSDQPLAQPLERALSLMAVPENEGFRLQLQGDLYPTFP